MPLGVFRCTVAPWTPQPQTPTNRPATRLVARPATRLVTGPAPMPVATRPFAGPPAGLTKLATTVTLERGVGNPDAWEVLKSKVVHGLRVWAIDNNGNRVPLGLGGFSDEEDTLRFSLVEMRIRRPTTRPGDSRLTRLMLEIPLETPDLEVPIHFRDVPLPR
jgi:hypothetical protein